MNRRGTNDDCSLIHEVIRGLPKGIRHRLGTVDIITGIDPTFVGLHHFRTTFRWPQLFQYQSCVLRTVSNASARQRSGDEDKTYYHNRDTVMQHDPEIAAFFETIAQ